ncbi:MAG: urea transporter, partial [Nanoarchaeota archaeon]
IAFSDKKWNSLLFALIAIILSVGIIYGFITVGLIALTAPFVFATWISVWAKKKLNPQKLKINLGG